jgi:hypothetical protein
MIGPGTTVAPTVVSGPFPCPVAPPGASNASLLAPSDRRGGTLGA